jgi:hypothetical protein
MFSFRVYVGNTIFAVAAAIVVVVPAATELLATATAAVGRLVWPH